MPCFLCSGAVVQFGIPKVIVGESVNFSGAPQFLRDRVPMRDLVEAENQVEDGVEVRIGIGEIGEDTRVE